MTTRRSAGLFALPLSVALAACNDDSTGGVDCPAIVPPTMLIQVTDASTGQPAAEGAGGSVTEGAFTSPLIRYGADQLTPEATNRPGTYTVMVTKPGYQTWTRTGVVVSSTECGARTAHLDAFLLPG